VKRRGQGVAVGAVALLLIVAAGLFALIHTEQSGREAEATIGGPFRLVDAARHTVTDRDFRGRYLLIYFGYTACPDVCPTTMGQMAVALQALGAKADRLQPIFVTIDPRRDTPEVIGRYAGAFGPRFIGLTGSAAQVAAVERAYHVLVGTPSPDGAIDHSSVLYLVAPDGHFLAPLRADSSGQQLAQSLRPFLS
jgi:protein SCO1